MDHRGEGPVDEGNKQATVVAAEHFGIQFWDLLRPYRKRIKAVRSGRSFMTRWYEGKRQDGNCPKGLRYASRTSLTTARLYPNSTRGCPDPWGVLYADWSKPRVWVVFVCSCSRRRKQIYKTLVPNCMSCIAVTEQALGVRPPPCLLPLARQAYPFPLLTVVEIGRNSAKCSYGIDVV